MSKRESFTVPLSQFAGLVVLVVCWKDLHFWSIVLGAVLVGGLRFTLGLRRRSSVSETDGAP